LADDVILVPYDPTWPAKFEAEKTLLLQAFPTQFIAIEHVGSTAIPGMSAKPIIDLIGGVRSMQAADDLLAPLCAIGYDTSPEFNATLTDRRFLLRWPEGIRTHHLHLVVYGGQAWPRTLLFRDRLRADPALASAYEALKHELAAQFAHDREAYTEAKTEFVKQIVGE
jgi:GrpB-like predicted nucleotidyltransferase (UPF0157 family)